MSHEYKNELSGKTVQVKFKHPHPQLNTRTAEFVVEDWWDRISDTGWQETYGSPVVVIYAERRKFDDLPLDEEVIYGKVGYFGYLVHASEIQGEAK